MKVGCVTFSTDAYLEFYLNAYTTREALQQRLNTLYYAGGLTNLGAGMDLARTSLFNGQNGDRSSARNLAIVITDGVPTVNEALTLTYADQLKQVAEIITVGVTDRVNEAELIAIASQPSYYVPVQNFDFLIFEIDSIISLTCDCKCSM